MQGGKTKFIVIGIFISLFIGFGLYNVFKARPEYERRKAEVEKNYYLKYGIQLKGIIVDKRPVIIGVLTSNYFTYSVKIATCNVREHDIREYKEDYYLLIKGDTAKFVNHLNGSGEVGDSISVNYIKGRQYVWLGQEARRGHDLPVFEINYNSLRKKGLGW
jgi:hypothetical protein